METALAWFGQLFETILSFIPHIKIVRYTHAGVKFRCGRYPVPLYHNNGLLWTGIHFYWPIVTEVEVIPIKRQTHNLIPQYLVTKDDVTVGVSGVLSYEIKDVVGLLTESYDYIDIIKDFSLAAVKLAISKQTYADIMKDHQSFDEQLTIILRERLKEYGIHVIMATLTDFSKCKTIGLWSA